jgi:hypothetical protein
MQTPYQLDRLVGSKEEKWKWDKWRNEACCELEREEYKKETLRGKN